MIGITVKNKSMLMDITMIISWVVSTCAANSFHVLMKMKLILTCSNALHINLSF